MPENAPKVLEPASPRIIQGYSLLEELGQGSFATAYRVNKNGREYCLREQGLHGLNGKTAAKAIELFRREAQVLSGLDHPQVPKVHDYFEATDGGWRFYLVQDLVPGQCLKSIVNPEGEYGEELARPFEEEKVVDIASQLSGILVYLHGRAPPVIHRDVKPSNVMMDETGKVYLIDFGNVQQELSTIVGGSTTFGTPGYAPLELCVPGKTTPKSDLYMLGMTMLNLASGIDPVQVTDHLRRVDYKRTFRFKNPSLEVVVDHLTQADPEHRPQSAQQVADYLEKIKAGKSIARAKDDTHRVWKYVAGWVPDSVLKHLVRTKKDVVEKAQRESQVLITDATPRIEVLHGEAKIEKTNKYWTFYNVPLIGQNNEEQVFRVTRGLLFDGKALTQEEYVQRLQGTEEVLGTVPEYLSLCAFLASFKDHAVPEQKKLGTETKQWLGDLFQKYWLVTGTRAVYHPDGSGRVVQGVGRDDASTVDVSALVGPDALVNQMDNPNATLEAICGTGNTVVVHQSFKDTSGKDSKLWRLNSNPPQQEERPVVLGVDGNDGFDIDAYYVSSRRALGWSRRTKNFRNAHLDKFPFP